MAAVGLPLVVRRQVTCCTWSALVRGGSHKLTGRALACAFDRDHIPDRDHILPAAGLLARSAAQYPTICFPAVSSSTALPDINVSIVAIGLDVICLVRNAGMTRCLFGKVALMRPAVPALAPGE